VVINQLVQVYDINFVFGSHVQHSVKPAADAAVLMIA